MTDKVGVTITDPEGAEHRCTAVLLASDKTELEVSDILIPLALHGQFYEDNGHECGMDVLIDSICFNINEGGMSSTLFGNGYSYSCDRASLLKQDIECLSFYVVGDLVTQLYGKSVTESVSAGALIFGDALSAKTVVNAYPGLTMFELDDDDSEHLSRNMTLVTSSVACAFAKQALTRMKEDYGDIDVSHVIQSVGERYFPNSLPRTILMSLQKSLLLHLSEGVELNVAIDSFISKSERDYLLVATASKELVLNRFTINEKDVNNHIPNTSAKGEVFFHTFTLDVLGESIDGSMAFFKKQSPYFGGRGSENASEPIAFFSPDNAGGVVVYNHPSIQSLGPLILAKMASYDDVDPSKSYSPTVKKIK